MPARVAKGDCRPARPSANRTDQCDRGMWAVPRGPAVRTGVRPEAPRGRAAFAAREDDREVSLAVDSPQAQSRRMVGRCRHLSGLTSCQSIGEKMNCARDVLAVRPPAIRRPRTPRVRDDALRSGAARSLPALGPDRGHQLAANDPRPGVPGPAVVRLRSATGGQALRRTERRYDRRSQMSVAAFFSHRRSAFASTSAASVYWIWAA